MSSRRRRRAARGQRDEFPGWAWMLFGLSIGLAVAVAVFVSFRNAPQVVATPAAPTTGRAVPAGIDQDGGSAAPGKEAAVPEKSRFDFYDMLPKFEVVIPEEEPDVKRDVVPRAVVEPGEYVLQAGSFSRFEDADRRRAELALQGIESSIQRVAIDDKTYHRVRIGPTRDLDALNQQRARLREANIDVLRIRLGD